MSPVSFYSIEKARLLEISHIVMALDQVLDVWSEFYYKGSNLSFDIDPDYKMLRIMAIHDRPLNILLTGSILQKRCKVAVIHIIKYITTLQRSSPNSEGCVTVASYNSTLPSARMEYAALSPLQQITAFAARDDYMPEFSMKAMEGRSVLFSRHEDRKRPELRYYPYEHREHVPSKSPAMDLTTPMPAQVLAPVKPVAYAAPIEPPALISSFAPRHTIPKIPRVGAMPDIPIINSGGPLSTFNARPPHETLAQVQARTTYQFRNSDPVATFPSHGPSFWRSLSTKQTGNVVPSSTFASGFPSSSATGGGSDSKKQYCDSWSATTATTLSHRWTKWDGRAWRTRRPRRTGRT